MLKKFVACVPYIIFIMLLIKDPVLKDLAWINFIAQAVIFLFAAHIPAFLTKRMSYVDVAWPLGLVAIGVIGILFGEYLVSTLYLITGGRMSVFALYGVFEGGFKTEFPRYLYQKLSHGPAMHFEIAMQGLANASFLFLPLAIRLAGQALHISWIEYAGLGLWLFGFIFENIADIQKQLFLKDCKKKGLSRQVCRRGVWNYCRHPNYFGEWMVWNGLTIIALGQYQHIYESPILFVGLAYLPMLMYYVLVYHTGAIPSEFFSVQKRPDYALYQREVPRFFPFRFLK